MAACGREPEVLVFQDTVVKRPPKRQRSQSRDLFPQQTNTYVQRKQEIEENGLDFRETMNEMRLLTAKSLAHQNKKGEKDLLLSLGAKPPPRVKIPYTRILNSVKKRKKNEANSTKIMTNNDKDNDKKEKEKQHTNRRSGKGRWRDDIKSLAPLPHTYKTRSPSTRKLTKLKL